MKRLSGIRLPYRKRTDASQIRDIPLPELVRIPMLMHTGAPNTPLVKPGDKVTVGQLIGDSDEPTAVPVHASVSGEISAVSEYRMPDGQEVPCVEITADGQQTLYAGCQPPQLEKAADLIKAARESGCVGLGGAGHPTHVKLESAGKPDILILNGAECEPYLTADHRQMLDAPDEVIGGIRLIMRLMKIKEARIGIQTDKPAAIKALSDACASEKGISVCPLPPVYPQGAEKVLVYHTCGRIIPEGKTSGECGILVLNVSTAAFLYRYSQTGIPLVEKVVTVDGTAIRKPCNLRVPVGTPVRSLLKEAGCEFKEITELISGGMMMGTDLPTMDEPVLKQQNGILAMKQRKLPAESACIRCGRCMRACPMQLKPMEIDRAFRRQSTAMLQAYHTELCMNCGCCAYVCPAKRPLAETIQLAKALLAKP